jgi:hypothetical protein
VVDPQVTTGFNTKMIYLVLDDLGYHVKNPAIVPQGGVSVRNRSVGAYITPISLLGLQ